MPDTRRIVIELVRRTFYVHKKLALEVKPGATYGLRQTSDAQVYCGALAA